VSVVERIYLVHMRSHRNLSDLLGDHERWRRLYIILIVVSGECPLIQTVSAVVRC
jgi:hypothetical protein